MEEAEHTNSNIVLHGSKRFSYILHFFQSLDKKEKPNILRNKLT